MSFQLGFVQACFVSPVEAPATTSPKLLGSEAPKTAPRGAPRSRTARRTAPRGPGSERVQGSKGLEPIQVEELGATLMTGGDGWNTTSVIAVTTRMLTLWKFCCYGRSVSPAPVSSPSPPAEASSCRGLTIMDALKSTAPTPRHADMSFLYILC